MYERFRFADGNLHTHKHKLTYTHSVLMCTMSCIAIPCYIMMLISSSSHYHADSGSIPSYVTDRVRSVDRMFDSRGAIAAAWQEDSATGQ